jgi:hypothetical protein
MIIVFFIIALFATQTQSHEINYIEFRDVRDSTNDFMNLRITYELCEQINVNNNDIIECQNRAFNRAITIDT